MRINQPLALLLGASLAAACGGDDEPATPDAVVAPDAETTPDAVQPATVSLDVQVAANQIPPGTRILFLGPDDAVVADVAAAPGLHTAELLPGGSVVVVLPVLLDSVAAGGPSSGQTVLSFLNVPRGAALVLAGDDDVVPPDNLRTVTAPTVPGATGYTFSAPCTGTSSTGAPSAILNFRDCGATTDVYVAATGSPAATGGGGGALLKTVLKRNVSTAADIDLTAETPANPVAFTLDVTGLRPSVAFVSATATTLGIPGAWLLYPAVYGEDPAPFAGGATQVLGALPSAPGGGLQLSAFLGRNGGPGISYFRDGAPAASATLAVGELDAPWLDAVVADVKTSTIRMVTSGAGAYHLAQGSLEVVRAAPSPVLVGGIASLAQWSYVALLDGDRVRIPTLPAAYAAANLTPDLGATGSVAGYLGVFASTAPLEATYATWFSDAGPDFGDGLVAGTSYNFSTAP